MNNTLSIIMMNSYLNQEYDHLFKILLLGDSGVGKSCIIIRYTDNSFKSSIVSSIGVDFKTKTVQVDDKIMKVQIWDTAGQERFRTITTSYYRGANAIVIVFSITDRLSYEHVEKWIEEIDKYGQENVLKFLVGNKCDLRDNRVVSIAEAVKLAQKSNMPYIETSAKNTINTSELFEVTIRSFLEKNKFASNSRIVDLNKIANNGDKKECCK